jgi:hypothetical protein
MSFHRIDLMPSFDRQRARKVRERWESKDGRALHEKIVDLVRKGAGEDFLQWDFEQGQLGFLEDYWDLAGIELSGEAIEFPTGDNFENIDFSYGKFWHCTFTNACFPQTQFNFSRLYKSNFEIASFLLLNFMVQS